MSYLDYLTGYWASLDFRKKSHELKRKFAKITTMSSKDSNEFQWTDDLVKEFWQKASEFFRGGHGYESALSLFKASKAPSPVIEKEWEILTCFTHGDKETVHDFIPKENERHSCGCLEMEPSCSIYSVRRIIDGIVYTVGDNVGSKHRSNTIISGFFIAKDNGEMWATCDGSPSCTIHWLSHAPIPPVREVLLTTEDGVGIYEDGDYVWVIGNNWNIDCFTPSKSFAVGITKKEKIFSTKELAENYALMNRAVLSIQDVLNISEIQTSYRMHVSKKELIQLVKQKIDAKIQ